MPRQRSSTTQSPDGVDFEELTCCSCLFYFFFFLSFYVFMEDLKATNPDLYFTLLMID